MRLLLSATLSATLTCSTTAFADTPSGVTASAPQPGTRLLTLKQAEELFLAKNREILAARRIAEAAEADIASAGAPPNPVLSLSTSSISPNAGIGGGRLLDKRVDSVVGITQLFERGNKRELRRSVAEQSAAAARSDQADVLRQQRTALYIAYFDLMLAQEKLRISSESAALFEKTTDAADRRLKAGDIAAADVARIQVDALRSANEARANLAELQRAQQALAYLTGLEKEARGIRAEAEWDNPVVPAASVELDLIIDSRPDVQAARSRVTAAERNRELARSLRTRDVTAGVQYERYPGDVSNNSYGVTLSIPLFTRYYYDGEIRRAEVEYAAAVEDLDRMRAQAITEIEKSRNDLQGAADRAVRLRDVLLAAAKKASDSAEFAYSRGALGVMDLLDARRQFHAARLEAAIVNADFAKALAAWRAATERAPDR